MMQKQMNIGVIGGGAFALFATKAFLQIPQVNISAVFDINKATAQAMAEAVNATAYDAADELLNNKEIDVIYIATPPHLHYEQSKKALLSNKHVICEKPAALQLQQAEELKDLAEKQNKLYVVNLMQRYNPLYQIVKKIVGDKILGNFLHGFFENYASDENLNEQHWFWDKMKSGGIFIEHGVHFFDLFSGWLGKGEVISSVQLQRPSAPKIIDRVQATVLYKDGIVNFYHGFDQPGIADRQEMKLLFERGDITLYGWIPVEIKIHGWVNKEQRIALQNLFSHLSSKTNLHTTSINQRMKGRGKDIFADEEVTIEWGSLTNKSNVYTELLQRMLQDQLQWIEDKNHQRLITDNNAIASLQMAEEATHKAVIR